MAVQCSKCGEELLGAVNRCWNCGTPFYTVSDEGGVPPIRREPIKPTVAAEVVVVETPIAAEVLDEEAASALQTENNTTTVRRGSPFSDSFTPSDSTKATRQSDTSSTSSSVRDLLNPRNNVVSLVVAISSLVFGILSVLFLFVSAAATFFTSVIGLGLGLRGLYGNRRGPAIAGIVLCCLALGLSGLFATLYIFELSFGYNPLDFTQPEFD